MHKLRFRRTSEHLSQKGSARCQAPVVPVRRSWKYQLGWQLLGLPVAIDTKTIRMHNVYLALVTFKRLQPRCYSCTHVYIRTSTAPSPSVVELGSVALSLIRIRRGCAANMRSLQDSNTRRGENRAASQGCPARIRICLQRLNSRAWVLT
jgi:hypothetical protein